MTLDYSKILKDLNLKITPARIKIFDFLYKTKRPVSAEEINLKIPSINLTTIYRTLEQFRKYNVISKIEMRKDKMYFEYIHSHHHHIICNSCGDIEDIDNCKMIDESKLLKKASKFTKIHSHSLEFFGTCNKCAKK